MTTDDELWARALAAATSIPRSEEQTVKLEDHPSDDVVHVRDLDVSDRRRPRGVEREVIDLLGLDPDGNDWVRLSLAWWRRVDALVARIEAAAVVIPAPRTAVEQTTEVTAR